MITHIRYKVNEIFAVISEHAFGNNAVNKKKCAGKAVCKKIVSFFKENKLKKIS
jgi:hypothetical protein